jgi:hypothetical protein
LANFLLSAELWSALDANIGVVIAALPSLRPYFRSSLSNSYDRSKGSTHIKTIGGSNKSTGPRSLAREAALADDEGISDTYDGGAQGRTSTTTPASGTVTTRNREDPWDDGKESRAESEIELVGVRETRQHMV